VAFGFRALGGGGFGGDRLPHDRQREATPTSRRDSTRAMAQNSDRRQAIKARLAEIEANLLGLSRSVPTKSNSLSSAFLRSLRYRLAWLLRRAGIIRKSDYRRWLRTLR
jgi:hypothetical protein